MAKKLPVGGVVTKPEFELDLSEATGGEVEVFIPVFGFLGDWDDPLGLVVKLGEQFWVLELCEFTDGEAVGSGPPSSHDVEENARVVVFNYCGNDQTFLQAVREWAEQLPA